VNGGVNLEHFHSYQTNKKVGADNNSSNNNIEDDSLKRMEKKRRKQLNTILIKDSSLPLHQE
jgi:hypothetical protein